MNNLLNYAPEIRVGAEKRIKKWSLRAGYRFEQAHTKMAKPSVI
jgi:long-subunit fatty acid transport protein